jgi:hypothetical protein
MPTKDEIKQFSLMIEEMAKKLKCNHIDAIVQHCNESGLEIEVASTLISSALKAKIREDAQDNNMMKRNSTLPL